MEKEKLRVEKRKVKRQHLVFYMRVFDGLGRRVVGHLMDLSEKGLMLLSDEAVAVNEEYRLRMMLPREIFDSEEIVFNAVSRWCKQDDNPDFFIIGFQIHDLDDDTEKMIRYLIDEFGLLD